MNGADKRASMPLATIDAWISSLIRVSKTVNSSPPRRDTISVSRTVSRIRIATCLINSSPKS